VKDAIPNARSVARSRNRRAQRGLDEAALFALPSVL
jgi:hypothetical protein